MTPASDGAPPRSISISDSIEEKLQNALKDDEGLLRLPKMCVSSPVHQLVGRMRSLMEEVCGAVEQGRVEAARDLNKLVRELCTLLSVLRPYVQKARLRSNPQCGAVFLTDCLYMVHVLLLMPYTYGKRLSGENQQLAVFVDLVPAVRRLGENHFLAMLRQQREQLTAALKPCDLAAGIARDRVFISAEAALGAAMQQVKSGAQGLSAALPVPLLREATGLLLGIVCRNLLGALFRLQQVAPEEVSCLSTLLTSALAMGRQVFTAVGLASADGASASAGGLDRDVPGWSALTITAELLGSDFPRFLERRATVTKALTKDEALKLLQLSLRDEAVTPHAAWAMLSAPASA